jgi:hypothetical protein
MGQDPDEIRQEIEATRERMEDTVEAIGYKADIKARTKESLTSSKDRARQTITQKRNRMMESIKDTKNRAVESLVGTKETVGERVGDATSKVGDVTPTTTDLKQGTRSAAGLAQENPLGLAIGSVAVGFLTGLVFRSTTVEKERIGPVADQVKDSIKQTGQEALERGQQVVEQIPQVAEEAKQSATEKVMHSAQEQAQELAASARERAQDVSSR